MRFLSDKLRFRMVFTLPATICHFLSHTWSLFAFPFSGKELADFYEQVPILIRELISRLNDENQDVLKAANSALNALSTHVPAEELVNHVEYMRNLIATMVSDARRRKGGVGDGEFLLPGFNMPKGKFSSRNGGLLTVM